MKEGFHLGKLFEQGKRIESRLLGKAIGRKKSGSERKKSPPDEVRVYRAPEDEGSRPNVVTEKKSNGAEQLPSTAERFLDEDSGPTRVGMGRSAEIEGDDSGDGDVRKEDFYRTRKLQGEKRRRKQK